jgi:hypothetical protein
MTDKEPELFPVLFERRLKYQRTVTDALVDVIIHVGYPTWTIPDIEAQCPVAVQGISKYRTYNIRGIDPMHSMELALSFLKTYLTREENQGVFFWYDGSKYNEK